METIKDNIIYTTKVVKSKLSKLYYLIALKCYFKNNST